MGEYGATGGAIAQTIQVARGYAVNQNYYGGAVGTLQGNAAGFTYCVLAEMFRGNGPGTRFMFGTWQRFVGGGQGIGCDDARWKMFLTQADGTKLENFGGAAYVANNLTLGRLVILHMVWNGTTMSLYVNGQTDVTPITPVGGLLFDATIGPTWGVEGGASKEYAFDGGIVAAAYGTTALTAAQVATHALACMDAQNLVQGAAAFANRYSLVGQTSAPATISDLQGAVNLTRVGALTLASPSPKWAG